MRHEVDTNILLDLLGGDLTARAAARHTLSVSLRGGALIVSPVVYAELDASFDQPQATDRFLADLDIQLDGFTREALRWAAEAWRTYTTRRGRQVQCNACGQQFGLQCPDCAAPIVWRQHVISDFLIGGHALAQADGLITRDSGYYRTYFPRLRLIIPAGP